MAEFASSWWNRGQTAVSVAIGTTLIAMQMATSKGEVCPSGWTHKPLMGCLYHADLSYRPEAPAQRTCTALGAHLPVIHDQNESTEMDEFYGITGFGVIWLGITDAGGEGTWIWADGSVATWSKWNPIRNFHKLMVVLLSSNGLNVIWLGITDAEIEGIWKWVDGSVASFTPWRAGQPDNKHYLSMSLDFVNPANCGALRSPALKWEDWRCGETFPSTASWPGCHAVCQRAPKKINEGSCGAFDHIPDLKIKAASPDITTKSAESLDECGKYCLGDENCFVFEWNEATNACILSPVLAVQGTGTHYETMPIYGDTSLWELSF